MKFVFSHFYFAAFVFPVIILSGYNCYSAIQTVRTDSLAKETEPEPQWQLEFLYQGQRDGRDTTIMVEFLVNERMIDRTTVKTDTDHIIQRVDSLAQYFFSTEKTLTLLILNTSAKDVSIESISDRTITNNQEIRLEFTPEQWVKYSIDFFPNKDTVHFFYIEKSGGIRNIRHAYNSISELIDNGHQVKAFLNGPGNNNWYTITSESTKNERLTFLNSMIHSTTEPPQPADEYNRVTTALSAFLANNNVLNLSFYMYISNLSYNNLRRGFINPLIEAITGNKLAVKGIADYRTEVFFRTDFEISDQDPHYTYEIISD